MREYIVYEIHTITKDTLTSLQPILKTPKGARHPMANRLKLLLDELSKYIVEAGFQLAAGKMDTIKEDFSVVYRAGLMIDEQHLMFKRTLPGDIPKQALNKLNKNLEQLNYLLVSLATDICETYGKTEALYILPTKYQFLTKIWP
ncbi:MAG TPA: hypothetical protein DEF42_13075 [Desulfosporosinus sp.]|nr:hypothetical protein [Desulfosporosinus sp.]